jgi:hypothetical protein
MDLAATLYRVTFHDGLFDHFDFQLVANQNWEKEIFTGTKEYHSAIGRSTPFTLSSFETGEKRSDRLAFKSTMKS